MLATRSKAICLKWDELPHVFLFCSSEHALQARRVLQAAMLAHTHSPARVLKDVLGARVPALGGASWEAGHLFTIGFAPPFDCEIVNLALAAHQERRAHPGCVGREHHLHAA